MIWAIVLAAGESRRMGRQKLLLPFGDTTIIGAVVRTALGSRADRTLVVVGADRGAIRAEIEAFLKTKPQPNARQLPKIDLAVNEDFSLGMLTSVQAGLRALPADAEAAIIMLGDQPFLSGRVVDEVVAAYERDRKGIVIPAFRGRRGHPVLIDLKYRDEILAIDPVEGLRRLMLTHAGDVLEVDVADANILRDLDTPEDYRNGIKS